MGWPSGVRREVARGLIGSFAPKDKAAFSGFTQKARSKAIWARFWTATNTGHEGALFELLKHKIRGNNLESLGGNGRRLGGVGDEDDAGEIDIHDEFESPDEKADQLDKRLQFEQVFCQELDQIDELNNLAGSDLGDAFGFTGANGRAVLSQLKKQIVASAQKRFNANLRAVKPSSRAKARQQTATA